LFNSACKSTKKIAPVQIYLQVGAIFLFIIPHFERISPPVSTPIFLPISPLIFSTAFPPILFPLLGVSPKT